MSESDGMTLIATTIKLLSGFDSSNVVVAQWGVLNSGKSRFYAIIKPGPTTRHRVSFGIRGNQYRTIVEVWYRYKNDGTTLTGLTDKVDLIVAKIDQYPSLGDGTGTIPKSAEASGLSEVQEQWRNQGDGPSWLKRDIFIDWTQESETTYAE